MQLLKTLSLLGSLALAATAGGEGVFKRAEAVKKRFNEKHGVQHHATLPKRDEAPVKRQSSPYLNPNSEKFVVDGTSIPLVDFDV